MKKAILFFVLTLSALNFSQAQEWMTSFEIAKRLALMQDKMIFMMWENSTIDDHPVLVKDKNGILIIMDLFDIEGLDEIVWKYFVPVIINESIYLDLYDEIKGKRKDSYIQKFNDDSIKIMDVNGNIINTKTSIESQELLDISSFIAKYSINTSFLKPNLISYSNEESFITSYYLASKYIDFASLKDKEIRHEIIDLSNIYLDEALEYLESNTSNNNMISNQAIQLLRIKQTLFLNNPKKALRQLKRLNASEIYSVNQSLFVFLNYGSNRLLNNIENAMIWQNEVSVADLKIMKYLIENN